MNMRKICVVITARPSYSRIKTLLSALKIQEDTELQLVVAASSLLEKYGEVHKQIESDGFAISHRVYNLIEGETLLTSAKTTGLGIIEMATVFDNLKPDMVVTVADRYETMATAIAASYMNIPLVHVQGGEVTGSIDEKVRHSITKLADYHMVASEGAYERVVRMGEDPRCVFITGCPSIDVAADVLRGPWDSIDVAKRYNGVGTRLEKPNDYFIVMQHPVTSEYEQAYEQISETLNGISELGTHQFYFFWPNVDAGSDVISKGLRVFREKVAPQNVWFFKNMSPEDFLKLLINSKGLIGNSSVGIRECSFLGVPTVNIGTRQSGRERGGNVIDVGYSKEEIKGAICEIVEGRFIPEKKCPYGDGDSGKRIARILAEIPLKFDKKITY